MEIDELKSQNKNCKEQIDKIREENKNLLEEISKLKEQNKILQSKNQNQSKDSNNSPTVQKYLHIKICEAKKLSKSGMHGKLCPYVSLSVRSKFDNKQLFTNTIPNTSNPVWNEEFNIILNNNADMLIINMYNKDSKTNEKIMDQLEFPIDQWKIGNPVDRKEIDIKLKKKKVGTLIFEVQAQNLTDNSSLPLMIKPNAGKMISVIMKIHVFGDPKSGKDQLITSFSQNPSDNKFLPAIGIDFKIREIDINGMKIKIQVWNDDGIDKFKVITASYFRNTNGIMIIFDVNNKSTFETLCNIYKAIKGPISDIKIPVIFVGNAIGDVKNRQVSFNESQKFSLENGCHYFELSESAIIDDAFRFLALTFINNQHK